MSFLNQKKVEEINRGHFSDKSRWSINITKGKYSIEYLNVKIVKD